MITIGNEGPDIRTTNYWESEQARAGLCYLTRNAGVWRLLVPDAAQGLLQEMQTGRRVTVEKSLFDPRCIDVVFEDGTDTPFALAIDRKQIDRVIGSAEQGGRLAIWTQQGKVMEFEATIKGTDL